MKVPLKPFTVEVKRSRSSSAAPKPAASETPVLIEAKPVPVQVSVSQARQLAEQMFASLTSPPSVEREILEAAENVFRAPEPVVVAAGAIDRAPRVKSPDVPVLPETRSAKPRKPRAGKVPTEAAIPKAATPKKAVKARALDKAAVQPRTSGKVVVQMKVDAARPQQVSHSLELPVPDYPEPGLASQDQGWGPGERWKRRLRYLR